VCDLQLKKKGFLIGRVTMHLDFGQDKQRLQSKPSGNMCKSIDKSHSGTQIVASKKATSFSGDDRGVLLWHSTGRWKECTAAAMMEAYGNRSYG
jgi:hypothetical protein